MASGVFKPRLTAPEKGNKYYIRTASGGFSPCIQGSATQVTDALNNCVGYAIGRYNEIYCEMTNKSGIQFSFKGNAKSFIDSAKNQGIPTSPAPALGAIAVWSGIYGHVAVVEALLSDGSVKISHSGYSSFHFRTNVLKKMYGGWYTSDTSWLRPKANGGWQNDDYKFLGFILNPAVSGDTVSSDAIQEEENTLSEEEIAQQMQKASEEINKKLEEDLNSISYSSLFYAPKSLQEFKKIGEATTTDSKYSVQNSKNTLIPKEEREKKLISSPTLVEVPFIAIHMGDFDFGLYNESAPTKDMQAPNYVTDMTVTKINGEFNSYSFGLKYIVRPGEDPNFMDKVFGSISDSRTIKISYGDLSMPTFVFREETAIITKVTSNVNFATSEITYTVTAVSDQLQLRSIVKSYPEKISTKPSSCIMQLIKDKSSGLLTYFPGLNRAMEDNVVLPTDDLPVYIEKRTNTSTIDYLNYLVSCMRPNIDSATDVSASGKYFLSIEDDNNNKYGGAYFKIKKVSANAFVDSGTSDDRNSYSSYVVDVGYPGEELVSNFTVKNNSEYEILYHYSDKIDNNPYIYKLDDDGKQIAVYSPGLTTSSELYRTSNANKAWWTEVTQFPIQATLTIRAVLQPILLISYIRINSFFYGIKHVSSGLYIVTKQVDKISSNGCKTELTLQRVLGDNEL